MDDLRERYRTPRNDSTEPVMRLPAMRPPAQTRPAPAPRQASQYQPRAAAPHPKPRKRRFSKKVLSAVIMLAILAGAATYAYPRFMEKGPFPADIKTNAQVSLLYPVKLPVGYTIDPSKIQMSNGILLYAASSGSKRLVFTIQQTPPKFDFAAFYKQQLQNITHINTKYGLATIGQNSGRYLASLVDGNTWMLVSSTDTSLSRQDINAVLNNLKQY